MIVPVHFLNRNTSAVLWVAPLLWILFKKTSLTWIFFATTIPLFIMSILNDFRFYGRLVVPLYQFLTFDHDKFWHESAAFFFVVAIPAFMLLMTPATVYGAYIYYKDSQTKKSAPFLIMISMIYLLFYTRVGHKEIRFILPIVPIFTYFAASTMQQLLESKRYRSLAKKVIWA